MSVVNERMSSFVMLFNDILWRIPIPSKRIIIEEFKRISLFGGDTKPSNEFNVKMINFTNFGLSFALVKTEFIVSSFCWSCFARIC